MLLETPTHYAGVVEFEEGGVLTSIEAPTHYVVLSNGKTSMFDVTNCETCNVLIEAPNGCGGVIEDVPKYKKLGMKELPALLEEGYYSDKMGQEACYNCNK